MRRSVICVALLALLASYGSAQSLTINGERAFSFVQLGEAMSVQLTATPGAHFCFLFSDAPGPTVIEGITIPIGLTPNVIEILGPGAIPPTGTANPSFAVPDVPALSGTTVYAVGAVLGAFPVAFSNAVTLELNAPPRITSTPPTAASVNSPYVYQVVVSESDGEPLTYSFDQAPAGMTVDGAGLVTWTPSGVRVGPTPVVVRVADPRGGVDTQAFVVTVAAAPFADVDPPIVQVSVVPNPVPAGDDVVVTVVAIDNVGVATVTLLVGGTPVVLGPSGQAIVSTTTPGLLAVTATAADAQGNTGSDTETVIVIDPTVVTPPTASISAPTAGATVAVATTVQGVASGVGFVRYRLDVAEVGTNAFALLVESTTPVSGGPLGALDPTLLDNGLYQVRLRVENAGGLMATTSVVVAIESGANKVGMYALEFRDMELAFGSLPLNVVRTYSSTRKTSGDFGIGWSLGLRGVRLVEETSPSGGWTQVQMGMLIPTYSIQPTRSHAVRIYLDGQDPEIFVPQPVPSSQVLFPITFLNGITYQPTPGSLGTLVPSEAPELVQPGGVGPIQFFDLSFELYDPPQFTYTDVQGFQFVFGEVSGASLRHDLQSITDPAGNAITIGPTGISTSSGAAFGFTRDAAGRITQIQDMAGNTVQYVYNALGQLAAYIDQAGNQTDFFYDAATNLREVFDPLGNRAVRNEYDADGRLIATIDPNGNQISINHDLGASQEIITDRNGNATVYSYDVAGNVVGVTDALGNTTVSTFDTNGRKTSETDALGNASSYTYNTNGGMLTATDPLGNVTTMTYGSQNQLLTVTDATGATTTLQYDASNNVTQQTDPAGRVFTYGYGGGNLTSVIEPTGATMSAVYDSAGNPTVVTDQNGAVRAIIYDGNGNPLTVTFQQTDFAGQVTPITITNVYDALGRVVQRSGFGGTDFTYVYDGAGRLTSVTDGAGRVTTTAYDALGRAIGVTHPDGTTETSTWDAEGNLLSSTDALGRTTTYEYDAVNRPVRTTYADGSTTETTYDEVGRIVATQDELGAVTQYEYDAAGRMTRIVAPTGAERTFGYDSVGRQTSVTDENGQVTTTAYDLLSREVLVTGPDGATRSTSYDATGSIATVTDEVGNVTVSTRDATGRLISVIDALGNTTTFAYDELGSLIGQTDALGRVTVMDRDGYGRLTRTVDPLGTMTLFEYDAVGNMIRKTAPNGQIIEHDYDVRNRLIRKRFPDASEISFTYTAVGQRATATLRNGTSASYVYDQRDRLVSTTDPLGRTITYGYDAAGNRTSLTTAAGSTQFSFDLARRLTAVNEPTFGATSYAYDPVGNAVMTDLPNGSRIVRGFDANGRLTSVAHERSDASIIASYAYTLRADGKRTQVLEGDGRTVDWMYDALGRLMVESANDPIAGTTSTTYAYDAVGNRTVVTTDGVATLHTHDANDRLLSVGADSFAYDANGNRTAMTAAGVTTSYGYDFENQLTSVQTTAATSTYGYDADGLRIQRSVGGITGAQLVDKNRGFAQVLEHFDGTGASTTRHHFGRDLIASSSGGATAIRHADGLGSTRVLTDGSEAITDVYIYDAYGNLVSATGSTSGVFLFAAEQFDQESGLYYLRARFYDPSTGRFMNRDLVPGDPDTPLSLHRFLYAFDDPVNNIDPSGLFTASLGGISISISISGVLTSIAYGATFGGLLGAADAFFGGGDVLQGFLNGALLGGLTAPFGVIALQVRFLRILLPAIGVVASLSGIESALQDRDYDLAAFRAVVGLAGLVFLGSVNRVNGPSTQLSVVGPTRWQSSAGAVYGPDAYYGNRVLHVLNHASNQNRNVPHGVFTVPRNQVLTVVDEGYAALNANRARYARTPGGNTFDVPLGRIIGFEGGAGSGLPATTIRIVLRTPSSNEIITAFPVR